MLLNLPTQPMWIDFFENIIDQRIKKRLSTPVELSFFQVEAYFWSKMLALADKPRINAIFTLLHTVE